MVVIYEDGTVAHNNVVMDAEEASFRMFADAYPHEAFDQDQDRFWKYFHEQFPQHSRAEMEKLLNDTREK